MFKRLKINALKDRMGQSTVEYIVLVSAVIAVIIVFMVSPNSPFKTKLNGTLNSMSESMEKMSIRMTNKM